MRELYAESTPYNEDDLKVSSLHTIKFYEYGNPNGKPVVFLHGGPGGGVSTRYHRYFDPKKWRIVLFDQRGCGKSTPFAEIKENTTWDLVEDIEKLRKHLNIKSWSVFGGSWGSTLALAYGVTYPESCETFFLRGIFLLRDKEIKWFYQEGCSKIYPDFWQPYRDAIPENERHDFLSAYYKRLTSDDPSERIKFAKIWSTWEGSTSKLIVDQEKADGYGEDDFALAFARIECHYFMNKGFFNTDNYLIENIDKIKNHKCYIVHGRYDVVCPVENAWELKQALPSAELFIIQNAGHALDELPITDKLIELTDND